MGRLGEVQSFERTEDGPDVTVDAGGGDLATAQHFEPAGYDAQPLPGDTAATQSSAGAGHEQALGYLDAKNDGKAEPGEARIYARRADGTPVCEFWLKASGDIEITSLPAAGGKIIINGVEIDQQGNITTPGAVDATGNITSAALVQGNEVASATVHLTTHVHTSAAAGAPTSPPTPGS